MTYFEPALPLLLLLGVVGLIRAWRQSKPESRPWLLTISVVGTLLISTHLVAWLFALPLEYWYSMDPIPQESAEAIVVLSGSVHKPSSNRPYAFPGNDSYERLLHGVWLFKHWKPLPILLCGGITGRDSEPYSVIMKRAIESEGVPADMIWVENRSKSTHESAVYGASILRTHGVSRIALVVEASSMPRAAASFRKAGLIVVPAPIRFTVLQQEMQEILPNWGAIALNGETLHELVGMLWYRLRGWI